MARMDGGLLFWGIFPILRSTFSSFVPFGPSPITRGFPFLETKPVKQTRLSLPPSLYAAFLLQLRFQLA
jgi:hypothetical protein